MTKRKKLKRKFKKYLKRLGRAYILGMSYKQYKKLVKAKIFK